MLRFALALLVSACGGTRIPTPAESTKPTEPAMKPTQPAVESTKPAAESKPVVESTKPGGGTGDVGAVCNCNPVNPGLCKAVVCKPELTCGYACGIAGCNSYCMTTQQFGQSLSIP